MTTRMGDRLAEARRRQFVGRTGEREQFRRLLTDDDPAFQLLYVYGPGGVGKTTLLREFTTLAGEQEVPAVALDARNIDPSPESFLTMLSLAMGLTPPAAPLDELGALNRRFVIVLDTYELLTPLDAWLRDVFLPQLPDRAIVVIAGRNAPAPEWRADPGWQTIIRTLPLRNLNPDESRRYLTNREVPAADHAAVLNFTHGHPLALSLVADSVAQQVAAPLQFKSEPAPDVVRTLVEQFVQHVPSPSHRAALESCSLIRLTTEPLLAAMLDVPDAHEEFDWLRGLSFIDSGRQGLFPHDTAREVLAADLRWRNPDWHAELHHRARRYYAARLNQTQGQEQQRVLFDYVYLHRDNPIMRPYLEWQESGNTMPDSLRPGDAEPLLATVTAFEGPESAAWLEY
ncbi:MAG TPA: AAA family ATPase, partial [Thermomicrobiaceae bacterium]|nr:AAA family ATPase [Thermomicrobiaceae bacterium]